MFLAIYDSPAVQAMLGVGPDGEPPRPRPGMDPARLAAIDERIAELKAGLADGGPREAAIRALLYIGMAGPGADERAFNTLRQIRAEHEGMTLEEFKQAVRAQYFSLVLDEAGALAALPKMLPADAAERTRMLEVIRRTVRAAGAVGGGKAERLAEVERLFGDSRSASRAAGKPAGKAASGTARKTRAKAAGRSAGKSAR
jgi:hypothetical protein